LFPATEEEPSAIPLFSPSVPYNRSSVIFSDGQVASFLSSSSSNACKPLAVPALNGDRNELLLREPRRANSTRHGGCALALI